MTKGVSKGITREDIVDTTLELIRDRENIRSVNLREIGRILGCAHTNLYNHFPDLDGIFWAALDVILERSERFLIAGMDTLDDPYKQFEYFYSRMIEFYLQNQGWFRLFWMEKLRGQRTESNIKLTAAVVEQYLVILSRIFEKIYQVTLTNEQTMTVFHTVHCYLYGEISIFISGRGLIPEEKAFSEYILKECIKLSGLLVQSLK